MLKEKFYTLIKNADLLNKKSEQELRDLTVKYPYFQAALILHLKSLKSDKFEETLKKTAVQIPQRKKLYTYLQTRNNTPNYNPSEYSDESNTVFSLDYNEETTQGNSLIDKFLSSNAGIITSKGKNDNAGQFAENEIIKKSTEENDEIITETLAMLYYNQKKYDKALEAFLKLSLKYPEKSVYFAARIDEIEKLKNI